MSKLIITPSPHIKSKVTTQKIMLHVIIALCPALIASVIIFGMRALALTAVCVVSCILSEYVFCLITKRERTVTDLSAVITGMLLAFNLPVSLPFYMAVIGSFVAIVIVKMMFGGIGQNFANPAATARIVLTLSFTSRMTAWSDPFYYRNPDVLSVATPLTIEKGETLPTVLDMFLGIRSGSLGETCILALLIGGIYLVALKIISPITPVAFILTVAALSFIVGQDVLLYIMSGGLVLGAVFMATDYATTPLSPLGKLIFGIGCGLVTFVIRYFGSMPEGVSFSILLMNILTPYIDSFTRGKAFGGKYIKEAKK